MSQSQTSANGASFDRYLNDYLERYISELSRLCAQPSVSASGEGVPECAALVAEMIAARGFEVKIYDTPGQPVVVGHARASGEGGASARTFLFYNHYDVQPPEPLELWTSPPFEPTLRDGKLFARGVADDKGEIVARLAAIDAIRATYDGNLPCNITFVVEGEEEVSSPHIAQFVKDHLDILAADGALWEGGGVDHEDRPNSVLGFRGIVALELSVETMSRDAHSGYGHILPNAAWRLLRALSRIKDENERILIPGFYDRVVPPSAADRALIDAQPDNEAFLRQSYGVKNFVAGRQGKELVASVFHPTCNIQGIDAGYQGPGTKTVIPAKATVKLDFRLVPDQDPEEVVTLLRRYLDNEGFDDVQITVHGMMWPFKAAADDPLVELTRRTAAETYGVEPRPIVPLSGGSSPAYAFSGPLGGIPVVHAGVGYPGANAHAPDENIRIQDFLNGARHIARMIDGFGTL
jgi:acetylornithine deacetylase/succinyl-diaminopimelate desuccinylase-like protein